MNCVLTKQNEEQVKALIRSGRYNNQSEVLRAGLRALLREEQSYLHPPPLPPGALARAYAKETEEEKELERQAARASRKPHREEIE
jgi:putative addiction module CopG family antidote